MEARAGLIAMHQIKGVGWQTINSLFQLGWEPDGKLTPEHLEGLSKSGLSNKTIERIKRTWTPTLIGRVQEELGQRQIGTLTTLDADYPEILLQISQPPWVLYFKGDKSLLLDGPGLAMVGTRKPTPYGIRVARSLAKELAGIGWLVVSGMAQGIDGVAHRGALEGGGGTVAVLGTGVDVIYPRKHRSLYEEIIQKGLVLSEMPPGTPPHPGLFPQRNRIISGLCRGTLVVEAAERSGSLITADFSMEQNREVFAIPGPITSAQSKGTNRLIQQGAKVVLEVDDILEEFPSYTPSVPTAQTAAAIQLSLEESRLLAVIGEEPLHVDELAARADFPVEKIHQHLLSLQMKQLIRQLPGAQFVREG